MFAKQSLATLLAFAAAALAAPVADPQAAFYSAPASAPPPGPPAPPQVPHTDVSSHGPFSGTPTTTGALSTTVTATAIPILPANPPETTYPSDGQLHDPQPAPYTPNGGLGTNGTEPVYKPQSDFDYESLVRQLMSTLENDAADTLQALALYQEWIELDLFHNGLASFTEEDFNAAGLTGEDRYLIQFMAEQEVGHATLITNILGAEAPRQCTYNYPFTTVREFVDFCQKLTRKPTSPTHPPRHTDFDQVSASPASTASSTT